MPPPPGPSRASGAVPKQQKPPNRSFTSTPAPTFADSSQHVSHSTHMHTPPRPPLLTNPPVPPRPAHLSHKPQTYRVQLRRIDPRIQTDRETIFMTCFDKLNAPLIRLTDTHNGFNAITDEARTIDKLTSSTATDLFRNINLTPIIPPDLKAKRTVFIRQLDPYVGARQPDEIKTELETKNKWLKINTVIKIKNFTHLIKIITHDTDSANRILNQGLYAFHTKITPHQCELEKFIPLQICYKCYKYETHHTNQCTNTTPMCSECGDQGHSFQDCKSTIKKCLNCSQPHRTLANSCPTRKQKLAEKEQSLQTQKNKQQTNTYSGITKQTTQQTDPPNINQLVLNSKTQIKLAAIIIEAHVASLGQGGNFGNILSTSLKLNFNIDTKFPDRNSAQIFNFYINQPTSDDRPHPDLTDDETTTAFTHASQPETDTAHTTDSEGLTEPQHHLLPQDMETDDPSLDPSDETTDRQTLKRKIASPTSNPPSFEELVLQVVCSEEDPSPIPLHPPKEWYLSELNKDQYGIKLISRHDPTALTELIYSGRYDLRRTKIRPIPHETFISMPRISRSETTKPKHRRTSYKK